MSSPAAFLERETVHLETGRILESDDDPLTVEIGAERRPARRAASCLLGPEAGDTVLIARGTDGTDHVLAVLHRASDEAPRVVFPRDAEIRSESGRLRISARRGIDLVSAGETSLVSRRLSVHAGEAEVHVTDLSFAGAFFRAQVETIKLFARACDSVVERISQRFRRSFRRVEDLDQVRARQIDHRAEKLLSLRGKYSMLTAEEDVRIDGDKILMG
jgi:hypothetical protein